MIIRYIFKYYSNIKMSLMMTSIRLMVIIKYENGPQRFLWGPTWWRSMMIECWQPWWRRWCQQQWQEQSIRRWRHNQPSEDCFHSTYLLSIIILTTMILILRFDTICAFISISFDDIIKISTLTTIDESIDALKAIASSSEPTKLISIHQRVKALMLNGHNQLIHLHPGERVAH